MSGQDCDGAWGQAPIRSLLALPRALMAPPRIESTDQAEGMMPVSERVRPEPRWAGIHHRSLRIGLGRQSVHSSPSKGEESGEGGPTSGRNRPHRESICRLSSAPPHPSLLPPGEKGLLGQAPSRKDSVIISEGHPFDKLRANGWFIAPFVVSLSNHASAFHLLVQSPTRAMVLSLTDAVNRAHCPDSPPR